MTPPNESARKGAWVARTYGPRTVRGLRDIGEFAAMAARLVARGRGVYNRDEAVRLAAEAVVHRIGEAVARLAEDFVDDFPELRLKGFKGMRNLVAHRYHDVDHEILWTAISVDTPWLDHQVNGILDRS